MNDEKQIERLSGPYQMGERILDKAIEKVTRRDTWSELKPELQQLDLFVKALHEREPTRGEMVRALGDCDEVNFDGWTVRACIDCSHPVAGGPTRCMKCVGKLEAGDLKALYEVPRLDSINVTDETVILLRLEIEDVRDTERAIEAISGLIEEQFGRRVPIFAINMEDEISSGTRDEIVAELDALVARNDYLSELGNKSDDELEAMARRIASEKNKRSGAEGSIGKYVEASGPNFGSYIIREGETNEEGDTFSADELREASERLGGDLVFVDGKVELHTNEKIALIPSKGRSAEGADNA